MAVAPSMTSSVASAANATDLRALDDPLNQSAFTTWTQGQGGEREGAEPDRAREGARTEAELAEVATLANRRVRLLAGYSSNSRPGVCEVELWGASPLRAVRTTGAPFGDANNADVTTVQHFYVPPGLDHLDGYGLDGACLVDPTGATIAPATAHRLLARELDADIDLPAHQRR